MAFEEPPFLRDKALKALAKAKEMEAQKLRQGMRYITDKTMPGRARVLRFE